jgi:hypothetical protein
MATSAPEKKTAKKEEKDKKSLKKDKKDLVRYILSLGGVDAVS